MKIVKADKSHLESVTLLFDLYRQFYGQKENMLSARSFIDERLCNSDSVIFLAFDSEECPVGFIQLYPSYSSVAMKCMWYLNDLYVVESARGMGVGRALLQRVKSHAIKTNSLTVKLATSVDNTAAKKLYISEGYSKVTAFEHFSQKVISE